MNIPFIQFHTMERHGNRNLNHNFNQQCNNTTQVSFRFSNHHPKFNEDASSRLTSGATRHKQSCKNFRRNSFH